MSEGSPENPRFERRSGRAVPDASGRSPTQRDRDRVLYSEAFRRLGGVTQVAHGTPAMSLHNRLTHSLKVEQVGSSILSSWSADNPDLSNVVDAHAIETACLAHDLGHPPFGHAGEQELNELVTCRKHRESPRPIERRRDDPCLDCLLEDGFEGNAQSFRILAVLAVHRHSEEKPFGLDLTRESLAACSKYPWTRGATEKKKTKWGAYDCDANILDWVTGADTNDPTLNAQVMDWADDISYAVHDIEDFYRVGLIPIDDYKANTESLATFMKYVESPGALGEQTTEVKAALDSLLSFLPTSRFAGRTEDLAALDRMRARLLTQFINGASLDAGQLKREEVQEALNAILKQFIWFHIIDEPKLANIQAGQRRVLQDIFNYLLPIANEAYKSGDSTPPDEHKLRRLPSGLRRAIKLGGAQIDSGYTMKQRIIRGLLDYLSALSDLEAYEMHAVLKGREIAGHL